MEFKNMQIEYAKRSIENYKKAKDSVEHEFTFLTGTLLAILSALLPDRGRKRGIISFKKSSSELRANSGSALDLGQIYHNPGNIFT